MDHAALRRWRRIASAAVSIAAVAVVVAKVQAPGAQRDAAGLAWSAVLVLSAICFVVLWRKEQVAAEAAFADRERQQLAALRLAVELAKLETQKSERRGSGADAGSS